MSHVYSSWKSTKKITPKAQDFKIWIISPHGKFYSVIILPVA